MASYPELPAVLPWGRCNNPRLCKKAQELLATKPGDPHYSTGIGPPIFEPLEAEEPTSKRTDTYPIKRLDYIQGTILHLQNKLNQHLDKEKSFGTGRKSRL